MKVHRFILFIFTIMSICIASPIPSNSTDNDPNRETLVNLLNELESKISEADRKMIAHPTFIEELRTLVQKYRNELREVFLRENFSDGDYTGKPKWEVVSGRFTVTSSKRLRNAVHAERPAEQPAAKEKPDLFGTILQEVLESSSDTEEEEAAAPEVKPASIWTNVQIAPAFEVDMGMMSESKWGSMEIALLGGKSHIPLYRMVYHASPSAERPIQIYRERNSRSYLIDEATKYPALDDGVLHQIQWVRDRQGNMKVFVDGKQVLSTVEIFYKENFSGFSIMNRGGTYEWGPIHIMEAQRE